MRARTVLSCLTAVAAGAALAGPAGAATPLSSAARAAGAGVASSGVRTASASLPLVTDMRVGRHATYDRLVLQLQGAMPEVHVGYVPGFVQDGSGDVVRVQGAAFLQVSLHPAMAHDEDSGLSTTARTVTPSYPALRQAKIVDDYEGYVTVGLGLSDRVDYRVSKLTNPTRLVIDVDHPMAAPTSTAARSLAPRTTQAAQLTGVRTGRHPGFDRVVFQFRGAAPGMSARYVRRVIADPSGRPLSLAGGADLQVTFAPATGHAQAGALTWSGQQSLKPGLPALREVRAAGDFESVLSFGLGVDEKAGFRVLRLSDPTRIAIDIAH